MRDGSAALTPMIELARMVGPTGIMWGDAKQIEQRFAGWADDWERLRQSLLTYANAHPSETVREQAEETVKVQDIGLVVNLSGAGCTRNSCHRAAGPDQAFAHRREG